MLRSAEARPASGGAATRIVAGLILLLLVAAGIVGARVWPGQVAALVDGAANVERTLGATGWLLAAVIQVLIALCGILPASFGALAAGIVYGVIGGFLLSAAGTLIGASIAFLLTRSLFRPLIARTLMRRPRMARLDEVVARDGWRLVCLLRISPVMPFAVTSYALGLTALDFRSYAIGTLASLPALLGYVVLGHLSGTGLTALSAGRAGPLHWALLLLAIGTTALLTLKLGAIVQRVFRLPDAP